MHHTHLTLISIAAGMAISIQSALSGQLSQRIQNPLFASASVYLTGFLVIAAYLALKQNSIPARDLLTQVPLYLWVTGGVVSAIALTSVYWVMPEFGVASTLLCVICGQLIIGAIASHFAWFGLPASPLSATRAAALLLVLAGASLYTLKPTA